MAPRIRTTGTPCDPSPDLLPAHPTEARDRRSPALRKYLPRIFARVEQREFQPDPSLNPRALLNLDQRVRDQLVLAVKKDKTPQLLEIPRSDGVRFDEALVAFSTELQLAMLEKNSRIIVPAPENVLTIPEAIERAEGLRQRFVQAIEGNGAEAHVTGPLAMEFFGGESMPRSRVSWVTSLKLYQARLFEYEEELAELPDDDDSERAEVLTNLVELLPDTNDMLELMILAVDSRMLPRTIESWGEKVYRRFMALDLLHHRLVQRAAVRATPHRARILRNLIAPQRLPSGRPVHLTDPEAPPEDGVTTETDVSEEGAHTASGTPDSTSEATGTSSETTDTAAKTAS